MKKVILLIDMDGVLCNWTKAVVEQHNFMHPKEPIKEEGFTGFNIEQCFPQPQFDRVKEVISRKGFYDDLEPFEEGLAALKDLQTNCTGYIDPFIVTAPDMETEFHSCYSGKARWVEKHLGKFWLKRLILSRDKTLIRGHLLIDDKPNITGVIDPTWDHLLYSRPWNSQVETPLRFTWKDWPELKTSLQEVCEGQQVKKSSIILAT